MMDLVNAGMTFIVAIAVALFVARKLWRLGEKR